MQPVDVTLNIETIRHKNANNITSSIFKVRSLKIQLDNSASDARENEIIERKAEEAISTISIEKYPKKDETNDREKS
jgi:hypothetical protein